METSGIIWSAKYYTLEDSIRPSSPKNKGKGIKEDGLVQALLKKNQPVTEEKAFQFLKITKYRKYHIVE